MADEEDRKFSEWLTRGIEEGWVTEPFCDTHDLDPGMGEEEQAEWEAGHDPCRVVLRVMYME